VRNIAEQHWGISVSGSTGASADKVDDLVKALVLNTGIPKWSVSRICKNVDADRTAPDTAEWWSR
jgi:heptaprenylglyceryl phosphate synthase